MLGYVIAAVFGVLAYIYRVELLALAGQFYAWLKTKRGFTWLPLLLFVFAVAPPRVILIKFVNRTAYPLTMTVDGHFGCEAAAYGSCFSAESFKPHRLNATYKGASVIGASSPAKSKLIFAVCDKADKTPVCNPNGGTTNGSTAQSHT
jgi:hypothetical protein